MSQNRWNTFLFWQILVLTSVDDKQLLTSFQWQLTAGLVPPLILLYKPVKQMKEKCVSVLCECESELHYRGVYIQTEHLHSSVSCLSYLQGIISCLKVVLCFSLFYFQQRHTNLYSHGEEGKISSAFLFRLIKDFLKWRLMMVNGSKYMI